MVRLIGVITIFAIFLGFTIANLKNSSDISFGFFTFTEVPVFVSIYFSFVLGMLCAIPLILSVKKKREKSLKKTKGDPSSGWHGTDSAMDNTNPRKTKKEKSSYGID